jgi:competence protein ComEA
MAEQSRGTVLAWVIAAVLATVAVLRLAGGGHDAAPPPVKLDGAGAGARSAASARARSGSDGVYVHVAGAAVAGPKPSLATATVEQLEELDGIGPTLAERIVEYRDAHGGFRSFGELRDVDGIGEKRFESLREALQP